MNELSLSQMAQLGNFGRSLNVPAYHFLPKDTAELGQFFELAKKYGLKIAPRGAGRSYNDAAISGGGIVLDLSLLTRILSWDAEKGIIRAEPGLTLEGLWQHVLPDGWWPPVVSGTMKTTSAAAWG